MPSSSAAVFITASSMDKLDSTTPTPEVLGVIDQVDPVAVKKSAQKERDKKQISFIADCTLDDVVVDAKRPKALKGNTSKFSNLQTIKGVDINQLGAIILRQFCINNKIEGYRNKTKLQ
jgi:hypothetical protein